MEEEITNETTAEAAAGVAQSAESVVKAVDTTNSGVDFDAIL